MKSTLHLSEKELDAAVRQFVSSNTNSVPKQKIVKVSFDHDGFPDSPDLRESAITYSAKVEMEDDQTPSAWD